MEELAHIPFAEGKIIWAEEGFDSSVLEPKNKTGKYCRSSDADWILGEALTNIYVGMCRYNRGEKLSAMRFVQSYAVNRVVDFIHISEVAENDMIDFYMPERRLEQRYPKTQTLLASFCQGYEKTPESALALLEWLEKKYPVNSTIAREIRQLIG